jgi:type II secretory pathway pseudopilin PulG
MKRVMKTGGRRGFTLIEVVVIVVCVAIMAVMVIESMTNDGYSRPKAQRAQCQNNLKQIGLAYRTWEGDYSDHYPMTVPTNKGGTMEWGAGVNTFRHYQIMSNELNNPKIIVCPQDNRNQAKDFDHISNQNVSYFIGLDTDETFPAMPISGDRNLMTNGKAGGPGLVVIGTNDVLTWSTAIHNSAGNVGLSDGSVQQESSAGLQQLFQRSGTNVNRLAIP